MTGYVRKDTTNNIADGNVINATDLDNEFDGLQDAFNSTTGHNHDGTTGEGAPILAVGPTQDVVVSGSAVTPKTNNLVDLGSSSLKFKDLYFAGNGVIGGTLAVTGVATLTAQPILSSLTASKAVFSDASKGLVSNDITGTGNVVMSASPTLTGTANVAGLTASGQIASTQAGSATTGAGQLYLNGATSNRIDFNSNGATTPSFTTRSDGTKLTLFPALSGSQVDYAIGISAATQWYSVPVNSNSFFFKWFGGETQIASLDGTGAFTSNTLTPANALGTAYGGTGLTSFTANGLVYASSTSALATGSALTFDGTNLGVGTTSPVDKFSVTGGNMTFQEAAESGVRGLRWYAAGAERARLSVDLSTDAMDLQSDYYIRFLVNGENEGMRLTSTSLYTASGINVGIGTSSPAYKLDIYATDATAVARVRNTTNFALFYAQNTGGSLFTGVESSAGGVLFNGTAAYSGVIGTQNNTPLSFGTNTTERMRLDTAGNLGLGVTPSAWGSGYKALQINNGGLVTNVDGTFTAVVANTYFDGTNYRYASTAAASLYRQNAGVHDWQQAASGTAGAAITFTQAMTLDASGNLGIGSTTSLSTKGKLGVYGTGDQTEEGTATATFGSWDAGGMRMYFGVNNTNEYTYIGSVKSATGYRSLVLQPNGGNLGLGVTPDSWTGFAPAIQLQNGVALSTYAATNLSYLSTNASYYSGDWRFNFAGSNYATRYSQQSGTHHWDVSTAAGTSGNVITFTQAMTLDASGNLGVGTTTPGTKLHVFGDGNVYSQVQSSGSGNVGYRLRNTVRDWYLLTNSAGRFEIYDDTAAATRVALDSSGNLGLGVTPSAWASYTGLQVLTTSVAGAGTGNNAFFGSNVYYNAGFKYIGASSGTATMYRQLSGEHSWHSAAAGTAGDPITFTQAMTLDASGNLGIGSSTIYNGAGFGRVFSIYDTNSAAISFAKAGQQYQLGVNSATNFALYDATAAAYRFTVDTAGNFIVQPNSGLARIYCQDVYTVTGGASANLVVSSDGGFYRSTSSLKYKQNVNNAVHGLVDLLQLRAVTYESKNPNEQGIVYGGLIAEEVHEAGLTEFVQYADDGTPDALAYGNMVALCVKAIQEQQAIIEEMKTRLAAAGI